MSGRPAGGAEEDAARGLLVLAGLALLLLALRLVVRLLPAAGGGMP